MSSLAEQICAAVASALTATIPAVGTRVYRAREDAISRDECPCIVVHSLAEFTEQADLAAETEQNTLSLAVHCHVAGGEAAAWETTADAIAVAAHALVRAATYPGNTGPPVRTGRRWEAASGDASPGAVVLSYDFTYFNATSGLDVAG